jgi:hypothetical protein
MVAGPAVRIRESVPRHHRPSSQEPHQACSCAALRWAGPRESRGCLELREALPCEMDRQHGAAQRPNTLWLQRAPKTAVVRDLRYNMGCHSCITLNKLVAPARNGGSTK